MVVSSKKTITPWVIGQGELGAGPGQVAGKPCCGGDIANYDLEGRKTKSSASWCKGPEARMSLACARSRRGRGGYAQSRLCSVWKTGKGSEGLGGGRAGARSHGAR